MLLDFFKNGDGKTSFIVSFLICGYIKKSCFVCRYLKSASETLVRPRVRHAIAGSRASAYIARDILKWYKENRLKKVYPDEPAEAQYILHGNYKSPYRGSGGSR